VAHTGFEEGGLRRLECLLSVHHEASQRVAEKAGAQRESLLCRRLRVRGRGDDAFLYGMLPDDLTAMDNQ
jgi:RimJ/RimL family protein N-acetyltransferase